MNSLARPSCKKSPGRTPVLSPDALHLFCHDFRIPLTSISAYAELIQSKGCDARQREQFALSLVLQTRRMARMVDNLELLSGENTANRCEDVFDAHAAAEAAVVELRPLAEAHGVAIELEVPPGHYFARGGAGCFVNALDWLLEAAQRLALRGDRVTVHLERAADWVRAGVVFPHAEVSDEALAELREFEPRVMPPDLIRGIAAPLWVALRVFKECGGRAEIQRAGDSIRWDLNVKAIQAIPE